MCKLLLPLLETIDIKHLRILKKSLGRSVSEWFYVFRQGSPTWAKAASILQIL